MYLNFSVILQDSKFKDNQDWEMLKYLEGRALKPEPQKDGYSDHGMDMVRYFFINKFPIRQKEFKVRVR